MVGHRPLEAGIGVRVPVGQHGASEASGVMSEVTRERYVRTRKPERVTCFERSEK